MTQNEQTSPQTPQRRGIRLGRRGKTVLALLLILIYALSPLGHYGIPKKSSIFGDEISPSGKYRVELYHPRYCPYAYFVYRFPFFFTTAFPSFSEYMTRSGIAMSIQATSTHWITFALTSSGRKSRKNLP